jgi:hypothetical protein
MKLQKTTKKQESLLIRFIGGIFAPICFLTSIAFVCFLVYNGYGSEFGFFYNLAFALLIGSAGVIVIHNDK